MWKNYNIATLEATKDLYGATTGGKIYFKNNQSTLQSKALELHFLVLNFENPLFCIFVF